MFCIFTILLMLFLAPTYMRKKCYIHIIIIEMHIWDHKKRAHKELWIQNEATYYHMHNVQWLEIKLQQMSDNNMIEWGREAKSFIMFFLRYYKLAVSSFKKWLSFLIMKGNISMLASRSLNRSKTVIIFNLFNFSVVSSLKSFVKLIYWKVNCI